VLVVTLAACGGGGGGAATGGGGGGGVLPTPAPPVTTNATGQLVTDPGGVAIAGVHVALQPWAAYPTPGPSPTPLPISATTDASGSFTLTAVPNGSYLLIIGSDSSADVTQPTIHDHITLTGGTQALVAPTLPAIPLVSFNAVETSGKYRFRSLTNSCFAEVKAARNPALIPMIADEWMLEDAYWRTQRQVAVNNGGNPATTTPNNNGSFGSSYTARFPSSGCADLVTNLQPGVVQGPYPLYGGYYEAASFGNGWLDAAGDMRVSPLGPGNALWP